MPEYLERNGGEIISVRVSDQMRVSLGELVTGVEIDGMEYRRHVLGGGLVADNSLVPDNVPIPYQVIVRPNTRVLTALGMAGQSSIWGNLRNPNQVSRYMNEEDEQLRVQQKLVGVIGRLLAREEAQLDSARSLDRVLF